MKPDIIYEDDALIAVNKQAGLLSIPDREGKEISLKILLQERLGKIFTVHRLDKGTSGVIVFAKDEATHKNLSQLFEERATKKIYNGLVHGIVENATGVIDAPIAEKPGTNKMLIKADGKPSMTEYAVLEQFKQYAWLQFRIFTGRTHQIRVHSQFMGNSIVCDDVYGTPDAVYISSLKRRYHLSKKEEEEKPILSRLALHASQLEFTLNDKEYQLEASLPKDLKALLQQLNKLNK